MKPNSFALSALGSVPSPGCAVVSCRLSAGLRLFRPETPKNTRFRIKISGQLRAISPSVRPGSPPARAAAPVCRANVCIYVVNLRILVANLGFFVGKLCFRFKIGGQLRAISRTERADSPPARTGAPVRPGNVCIYVANLRILVPYVAFRAGKVGPVFTNVLFPNVKLRPLVRNTVFRVAKL